MSNPCTPETSFLYRIFMFLLILAAGLIATYVLFLSVVFALSDFNMTLFNQQLPRFNVNVNLLRIMQTLQSLFVFIIPPFILSRLYKENSADFLHLKKPGFKPALIGTLSIVLMMPLINVLVQWNAGMHLPGSLQGVESWMRASEDAAEAVTKVLLQGTTGYDLVINLIIVGLLAGVGEEFLFRGVLQSMFSKELGKGSGKNPDWVMHTAIWVVAFLFSAIHLQFYGFIPRLLLGVWFGYLLWWTGSIWVPVLAHFANNALSTVVVFLQNKGLMSQDPDRLGLDDTWWLCLVSVFLLAGCVFCLKQTKNNTDFLSNHDHK